MNMNNFSGSSREWVGVKFVYVLPSFLGKEGNTLTKFLGNLRKMPGQSRDKSRENCVYVFPCLLVLSGPILNVLFLTQLEFKN